MSAERSLLSTVYCLLPHLGHPEGLAAGIDAAQAARGEVALVEAEVGEVGQVAQDGLEPAVAREQRPDARVLELREVEGEHGEVLRGAGRGHRLEDALVETLAEVDAAAFEFEHR